MSKAINRIASDTGNPRLSIRVLVLSKNAGGDSGVFSTSHSATFSTKVTGTDQVA